MDEYRKIKAALEAIVYQYDFPTVEEMLQQIEQGVFNLTPNEAESAYDFLRNELDAIEAMRNIIWVTEPYVDYLYLDDYEDQLREILQYI